MQKSQKIYKRYVAANLTGRRGILKEVGKLPLPKTYDKHIPFLKHGEWFIPAKKLCALIEGVAELDVMQINPGPAGRSNWLEMAYKGGSETGVLNLTTQVKAKNGDRFCVVTTWNNRKLLQERKLILAYRTLMKSLANLHELMQPFTGSTPDRR